MRLRGVELFLLLQFYRPPATLIRRMGRKTFLSRRLMGLIGSSGSRGRFVPRGEAMRVTTWIDDDDRLPSEFQIVVI